MTDRPLPGGADTAVGPTPGYYPDPSIPGFVRYWGGAAWVPGTSRPAPVEGELLEPPRFTARQAASQTAAAPYGSSVAPSIVPSVVPPPGTGGGVAETGPMYFDQTSGGVSFTIAPQPAGESAEIELRPRGDVEAHRTAEDVAGAPRLEPVPDPFAGTPPPGALPGALPGPFAGPAPEALPGSFPGALPLPEARPGSRPGPFAEPLDGPLPGPFAGPLDGSPLGSLPAATGSAPSRGSGWWADPGAQPGLLDTGDGLQQISWGVPRPTAGPAAELPPVAVPAAVTHTSAAREPGASAAVPQEPDVPAGTREPVAPAAAALPVQASARTRKSAAKTTKAAKASAAVAPTAGGSAAVLPAAGLGARLCARLLDGLVVAVVGVAAGVPLAATALRHLQEKLDQARMAAALTGRQAQVWLVDSVVLGNAAALLAVLALLGFLCEVLPTARTGQTFGKRLMRIRVVDAAQRAGRKASAPPSLGRSVVRWLVGQLALLLVVGPLWPLFDRRSRRGWQDRAARTRVVRAVRG